MNLCLSDSYEGGEGKERKRVESEETIFPVFYFCRVSYFLEEPSVFFSIYSRDASLTLFKSKSFFLKITVHNVKNIGLFTLKLKVNIN